MDKQYDYDETCGVYKLAAEGERRGHYDGNRNAENVDQGMEWEYAPYVFLALEEKVPSEDPKS